MSGDLPNLVLYKIIEVELGYPNDFLIYTEQESLNG
jgi:hypothetical protein